jgi:hypothetical protein
MRGRSKLRPKTTRDSKSHLKFGGIMPARDPVQALSMVGHNQTKKERSPNDAEADVLLFDFFQRG